MTYLGLDAFRLFAFLAVFLFHVRLFPAGYLGVLAFFVLSGFLITPILVDMHRRLPARRYFLNFYGRRSLRIFPLYYFYLGGLGACLVLGLAINRVPAALAQFGDQLPYALSYTYDFFHASRAYSFSPLLTHFWSLALEEQFYLVWPFVIFLVGGARLKSVLLALLAAGPVIRLAQVALVMSPVGSLFHDRLDLVIYVLPFSHIDAFAMGGYMALYGRTPSRTIVALYAGALISVGLITEGLGGRADGLTLGYGPFMADSWKQVWAYTCVNLLFGWLLLMIRDRALVPRLLEHPAVSYLGKISYGLYVYHFAVIWLVSSIDVSQLYGPPVLWRALSVVAMLGITVTISMASYALLEAPFLRLKDKYFAKDASRSYEPPRIARPVPQSVPTHRPHMRTGRRAPEAPPIAKLLPVASRSAEHRHE